VTVLKGGVFFVADLARRLEVPATLDFLAIAGYGSESPVGAVRLTKDLDESITGRHVLMPACGSASCSTAPIAGWSICQSITRASSCRTVSSSATVWTGASGTGTCHTWRR
jgi:hypothetical protein